MEQGERITPMMKQFLELKKQYSDCILLFRAGDFYETFYDDAKIASKVLGITLTKRGETPMAGVPFHSINPYIKKLVQNNYKVAMCEQLEDPKQAKGLVKRGVTRVITPGTILEDEYLSSSENNYIMCIYSPKDISEKYGISIVDITTSEFLTTQVTKLEDVKTIIKRYSPNEIILNESSFVRGLKENIKNSNIYYNFLSDIRFNINYANEILKKQFGHKSEELGLESKEYSVISSGALLFYIYKLQKLELSHINKITYINLSSNMVLDSISLRNLEIIESLYIKDKSKTLYGILNNTKTSIGARLLKSHIVTPLLDKKEINKRLDGIEELNELIIERDEIREMLDEFFDIERITSRISSGLVSPKDLFALKISLQKLPKIKEALSLFQSEYLTQIKKIDVLKEITELLENSISESAPAHLRDIGYIKKDYNDKLKELFDLAFNSKDYIKELEESERLRTGISTLRIRYNRIFGYFIEIPKTQSSKIPDDYILRQTLANNFRYTKEELKEKEVEILGAEEKIKNLEKVLFEEIVSKLKFYIRKFQEIAGKIALLDVLTNNSLNSQLYDYTRPKFNDEKTQIIEGKNPIVERFITEFIPNDTFFDKDETIKIVTGPNMAGKSTYLRQNALIIIMAQAGFFVPAKSAELKIYDRVFTRIGAHDELSEGQSTFMVEMTETANIINNATEKSFVLLDEIGRGTSTYDGLSIAWAITEELNEIGADTIFATHYHQLNKLSEYYSTIENYNVMIREEGDNVEFLRKIIKGGTDKSFGIYVGKLAGIPEKVLNRAKEVQTNIEEKEEIVIKQEFKETLVKKSKKNTDNKNKGLGDFI
ncbi:MAG: DNA mismatch repair protein MutS [Candidatus Woesearchaeota archaeon]|jgi:DNA mismatch repair protein MutS|nr:DNA mismatch repair protein MutS [Candidatus Woesearchaeota archaeon]